MILPRATDPVLRGMFDCEQGRWWSAIRNTFK